MITDCQNAATRKNAAWTVLCYPVIDFFVIIVVQELKYLIHTLQSQLDIIPQTLLSKLNCPERDTISARKCTPLNQPIKALLALKEKLSCDWVTGVHFYAKIVHVQEL